MAKANRKRKTVATPSWPSDSGERGLRSIHTIRAAIAIVAAILLTGGMAFLVVTSILAEHPAGSAHGALPAASFEEIPEEARKQLEFVWLERVDEAVSSALESETTADNARPGKAVRHLANAQA